METKMEQKEMKTIDLRTIKVKTIDDKEEVVDVSKGIGNGIYKTTSDIGELILAQEIYKTGIMEINDTNVEILRKYIKTILFAFAQIGVENELSKFK